MGDPDPGPSTTPRRDFIAGGIGIVVGLVLGERLGEQVAEPRFPADWYVPPEDSGYRPGSVVAAPGSPAFPGKNVKLTSDSGEFGDERGEVALACLLSQRPCLLTMKVSTWTADTIVARLPEKLDEPPFRVVVMPLAPLVPVEVSIEVLADE